MDPLPFSTETVKAFDFRRDCCVQGTVERFSIVWLHLYVWWVMRRESIMVKVQDHIWYRNSSTSLASLIGFASAYLVRVLKLIVFLVSTYDQLADIVKMSSLPLPERPDGIVTVVKYTSASTSEGSRATEAEYERLARKNPSTLFLRCFVEYEDAEILFGQAGVVIRPTFDVFYRGNRVARVEGPNQVEVEQLLERYQFQNSKLDLFSEESAAPWGTAKIDYSKTPRTTNRFIPGYDWDSNRGFFDATADKMEEDFMGMFEDSWLPKNDDSDKRSM